MSLKRSHKFVLLYRFFYSLHFIFVYLLLYILSLSLSLNLSFAQGNNIHVVSMLLSWYCTRNEYNYVRSFCSIPPSDKSVFLVNRDHNLGLLSYPGSYNIIIFVSVSFEIFDNSKLSQSFSFFTYLLSNFSY